MLEENSGHFAYDFFISDNFAASPLTEQLVNNFRREGFKVYYDKDHHPPSAGEKELSHAMRLSQRYFLVLADNACGQPWSALTVVRDTKNYSFEGCFVLGAEEYNEASFLEDADAKFRLYGLHINEEYRALRRLLGLSTNGSALVMPPEPEHMRIAHLERQLKTTRASMVVLATAMVAALIFSFARWNMLDKTIADNATAIEAGISSVRSTVNETASQVAQLKEGQERLEQFASTSAAANDERFSLLATELSESDEKLGEAELKISEVSDLLAKHQKSLTQIGLTTVGNTQSLQALKNPIRQPNSLVHSVLGLKR